MEIPTLKEVHSELVSFYHLLKAIEELKDLEREKIERIIEMMDQIGTEEFSLSIDNGTNMNFKIVSEPLEKLKGSDSSPTLKRLEWEYVS